MPFVVTLDQMVELPGTEVYAAQQSYARSHSLSAANVRGAGHDTSSGTNAPGAEGSEIERDPDGTVLDSDRPKLKRRPKNPHP
jgi:hypothetical protein